MLPRQNPIFVRKMNRETLTQQPAPVGVKSVYRIVHNFPIYDTDARGIVRK